MRSTRARHNLQCLQLEDRVVPSYTLLKDSLHLDSGVGIWRGQERIPLYLRANEIAVRVVESSANSFGQLNQSGSPLAGMTVDRVITPTLAVFRDSAMLPSPDLGNQYASRLSAVSKLPGVVSASPVYAEFETQSWSISTGEVIIRMPEGKNPNTLLDHDANLTSWEPLPGTPDQFLVRVAGGAGNAALFAADYLRNNSNVLWAAPNFYSSWQRMATTNDPLLNLQWHLNNTAQQSGSVVDADADVFEAWDVTFGGSSQILVAVVDDGMEISHPDLAPNIYKNSLEQGGKAGFDDDGNGWVDDFNGWDFTTNGTNGDNDPSADSTNDYHSTPVAGVTAAKGNNGIGVAGVAFNSKIMPIRIFGSSGFATTDANIASSIYYAAGRSKDGTKTFPAADIQNHSWGGGPFSQVLFDAFTWASINGRGGKGTLSFVATGNNSGSSISYPAKFASDIPGVIAVGASTNQDNRASYSQFGPEIDFLSPSDGGTFGIVTVDRVGANGTMNGDYTTGGQFGGTSSATPLAAGIGALIMALDPNLTVREIRGLMRNTTDYIGPPAVIYDDSTGFNIQYGYGRVNAFTAVSGVGKTEIQVLSGRTNLPTGTGTVAFGSVTVGNYASRILRIRNQGTLDLTLSNLAISGPFQIESSFGLTTLRVGDVTTIVVRFVPTAAGFTTGTLTFTTNDADEGSYVLQLNGTGVNNSISGYVFEDVGGDGTYHPTDLGIAAQTVFIDTNLNGNFDTGEPTTTTTALGYFSFTGLADGTYKVVNPNVTGWNRTNAAFQTVTIAGSVPVTNVNFGLGKADHAYGRVAIDTNTNNAVDPTEKGLQNWLVFNDLNNNGLPDNITVNSGPINLSIPDNNLTGVSHTINISASGTVFDVDVAVNMTHTWIGDIRLTLTGPGGQVVPLITNRGSNGKNMVDTIFDDQASKSIVDGIAPFTGRFRPESPLSIFNNKSVTGAWTIKAVDSFSADLGVLHNWELRIITEPTTLTDVNGNYRIPVAAGGNTLRSVLPPNWSLTTPAAGKHTFNHTAGETAYAKHFGVVKILPMPPENVNAGGPYTITEGDSLTLSGSATDSDSTNLDYSWDINGDGVFGDATGPNPTLTWAQLEALGISNGPSTWNVRVTVTDQMFWRTSPAATLTLTNANPTAADFSGVGTIQEGTTSNVGFTGPTDASKADRMAGLKYAYDFNNDGIWDLGTGTYAGGVSSATASIPASFLADNGTLTIVARVIDQNDGFTEYTTTVTILNVAPTATSFTSGGPVMENSPGSVTISGAFDPSPVDTLSGFRYAYDFGGDGIWDIGNGLSYATGTTLSTVTVPAEFLANGPMLVPVIVRIFDKDNDYSEYSTTIQVINADPTANLSSGGSVVEGQAGSVLFTGQTDPSPVDVVAGFKYAYDFNADGVWDLGDGLTYAGGVTNANPVVPATFLPEGPSVVTIIARIFDQDNGFTTKTTTITVVNGNPTATLSAGPPAPQLQNGSVSFSKLVDSPGDLAAGLKFAYDFDNDGLFEVGDGTYVGSVTTDAVTVPASFLPELPGLHTVKARVIDRDGGFTDYTTQIKVVNVPPTATLSNGGTVTEFSDGIVMFSNPQDVSALDTAAGFKFAYDFNNDGIFDLGDGTYAGSVSTMTATVAAKYLPNGPANAKIRARVIDQHNGFTDYFTIIPITNVNPTATFGGSPTTTEGSTTTTVGFSNQFDISPVDVAAGFKYAFDFDNDGKWDLGNGTYLSGTTNPMPIIPAGFLADGPFQLTVRGRILDQNDGFSDYIFTIDVQGVAPTAKISNSGPVPEGSVATVLLSDRKDVSLADQAAGFRFAYDFDNDGKFELGDGTFAGSSLVPAATVPAKYLTNGPGFRTVRVRIIDKDNDFSDLTTDIEMTNLPPTASLQGSPSTPWGQPSLVSFTNIFDPSAADLAAGMLFSFDFNNNGSFLDPGDVLNSKSPTASFVYPMPGTYIVNGRVMDQDGGFSLYTTTIVVRNVPPTATLSNSGDVLEGGRATVRFSNASHPSASTTAAGFRYAFDFDNDGIFEIGSGTYAGSVSNPEAVVPPELLADGPVTRTIRGRIIESNGLFTDYVTQIRVFDVPPTFDFIGPTGPIFVNTPFPISFRNAADPSAKDLAGLTYRVEMSAPGSVTTDPVTGRPTSITISQAGQHTITAFARDPNGVEVSRSLSVVVRTQNWFAVGPDDSAQPVVKLFNNNNEVQFSKLAFGDWITSGVRVASGDINGDGIPDLVAGTGPGYFAQLRVIDGKSQRLLQDTIVFEETFTGGIFVATGDLDGDGFPELIVSPDQGGGPRIRVLNGRTFQPMADFMGIDDPNFRGGARVSLGDVNGDGFQDLIVSAGFGGGPRVAIFDGRTLGQVEPKRLVPDFFAFEQTLRNGVYVAAGDLDGDGFAELVVGGGPGGGPRVQIYSAKGAELTPISTFFAGNESNRGGIRVAVKDLDSDGKAELIVGSGTGAGSTVTIYEGTNALRGQVSVPKNQFEVFDEYEGGVFVG